jgi:uncharacterized membrane protein YgcG
MHASRRIGLALLLLAAALAPTQAQERILYFLSDVQVQKNGDLIVTETIRVQAEGVEIRRGILRDFPTTYRRPDGMRVQVGFDVLSVERDGAPEEYRTESLSNGVRIRIGSANRVLSRGRHEYLIRYRTTRQIGFFADFDELYWNATGTGWTFAIDRAEARITLPERVQFRQSAFYTGPQGARGKDAKIVSERPGQIVFGTIRRLPPRNGLTVAAAWQKGVVDPPSAAQQAAWWLRDNLALIVAALGFVGVAGYYLVAWMLVGRDPARGTIIPLFGPPKGMSAAAVRYVARMGFDDRAFTAAILDLAVRGHLRLVEQDDTSRVEKREGDANLGAPEQAMKAALFSGQRSSLELDQENHRILGAAKDTLKDQLEKNYSVRMFHANTRWAVWGMVAWLALVLLIAITLFATYGSDEGVGMLFGNIFVIPGLIIGALLLRGRWRGGVGWIGLMIGGVFSLVLAVAGLAVIATGAWAPAWAALAPAALAPLVAVGFGWLKAPSIAGRKVMDEIEGFREYLGVAEEDRLEFLHPPQKTPELFERYLPYAIALDVENTWAKRFASVLAAAGTAAAAPSWYSGSRDWTTDPVGFANRIGSDLSSTIASASTPPGSSGGGSGSSGGGSSGGGGGGGGGSGW